MSEESKEFVTYRRDLEAQEAFKANTQKYRRAYVPTPQVKEICPKDRD